MDEFSTSNVLKLVLLVCSLHCVQSAHILGVPSIGISHGFVLMKIGRELVERGHRYTLVVPSALEADLKPKNAIHGLQVMSFESNFTKEALEKLMLKQSQGELDMNENMALWIGECEDTLRSKIYSQNLQDVGFMLCDIGSLCCTLLADLLGIQRIDISPTGFGDPFLSIIHNFPASLAHIPQMPYWLPRKLSFIGRVQNFILYGFGYLMYNFYLTGPYTQLWKKYVPNSKFKNLEELFRSTGLLLIPTDFALSRPRSIASHMKVIGPVLPEPPKPLPQQFQKIISSAQYSDVIVVSFGTVISNFGDVFVDTLASALSKIPAQVIWKHKGKKPKNISENVKIFPWFPQNDFLGHPATKVFITHGGLNSIYESSFHGVPMVVIPWFGDQFDNALAAENAGTGEMLHVKGITEQKIIDKVNKVLSDASYMTRAKQVASQIIYQVFCSLYLDFVDKTYCYCITHRESTSSFRSCPMKYFAPFKRGGAFRYLGESMRERREEKRAPLVESVGNLTSMLGPKSLSVAKTSFPAHKHCNGCTPEIGMNNTPREQCSSWYD
ncbi:hypothetical protein QZH41_004330 [Actinostola sp. cb2023]|nr:hypothetical protein QZH41_004330 [Actinostola sp. cb2023]